MGLKPLKIGKHRIKYPIFQGGMGVGISWDRLAGNVSKEGALGIISAVGTGYYQKMQFVEKITHSKPFEAINFYSKHALNEIFKNALKLVEVKKYQGKSRVFLQLVIAKRYFMLYVITNMVSRFGVGKP